MTQQQGPTGTVDVTYDLVSILYHSLEGAEIYDEYVQDAEDSGASDLAQFFRDVQQEETRRADRAKGLLREYLNREAGAGGQRRAA